MNRTLLKSKHNAEFSVAKRILIFSLSLIFATTAFAQTDLTAAQDAMKKSQEATAMAAETMVADSDAPKSPWKLTGISGLNFTQTALSNWSAGGENTVAANVYLNAQLSFKKNRWAWDNQLNTEFGMLYTKTNNWQKSADKLQFTSKVGFAQNKNLYYSFLVDFSTQYAEGYKNPTDENYISNWMAPGYLNLAIGIDYKPTDFLSVFVSPLTDRLTFVLDDSLSQAGSFGVKPGDRIRSQIGMYAKVGLDKKITDNIQIMSTLDLFSAYETFGMVVINWDVLVSMKINKFLTTTLNLSLRYDDAVKTTDGDGNERGPKVQFKEMLGLGIAYSF